MFEAILFLAAAMLFFLAVLFFVFLWQDRLSLRRRKRMLEVELAAMKEERVELDIWQHELKVWAEGLEEQQLALEQAQEELRMLTAEHEGRTVVGDAGVRRDGGRAAERTRSPAGSQEGASERRERASDKDLDKNLKAGSKDAKLYA